MQIIGGGVYLDNNAFNSNTQNVFAATNYGGGSFMRRTTFVQDGGGGIYATAIIAPLVKSDPNTFT